MSSLFGQGYKYCFGAGQAAGSKGSGDTEMPENESFSSIGGGTLESSGPSMGFGNGIGGGSSEGFGSGQSYGNKSREGY